MEGLIKVTPNKERVKHILRIAEMTVERIQKVDTKEFVTLTTKDYYDVIREQYQYGIAINLKEQMYKEMFKLAQEIIIKTKEIIEE